MVQTLAKNDPTRYGMIMDTVMVRDGLEAYLAVCQEAARRTYEHAQSLFVAGGMKKPPPLPAILKPRRRRKKQKEKEEFVTPEKPAFLSGLEAAHGDR